MTCIILRCKFNVCEAEEIFSLQNIEGVYIYFFSVHLFSYMFYGTDPAEMSLSADIITDHQSQWIAPIPVNDVVPPEALQSGLEADLMRLSGPLIENTHQVYFGSAPQLSRVSLHTAGQAGRKSNMKIAERIQWIFKMKRHEQAAHTSRLYWPVVNTRLG